VDVRSEGEYGSGHLDGVVNIPMDRFKQEIGSVANDKSAPLLLHCASGGRSALACRMAKGLGYTHAHNLGSYTRARRLLQSRH
jgi:phage shock protein E